MQIKKFIFPVLTLSSVFCAGWWIGTSRQASDASLPILHKQDSVQTAEVNSVAADEKTKPSQVSKTVQEITTLYKLNVLLKIQVGKVDELKSDALKDLQNYYVEFAPGEEPVPERDAMRQILISRIERVSARWPELSLCPISEDANKAEMATPRKPSD